MSLADWLANRWIVAHEPTVDEISDLFALVDRGLPDAAIPELGADGQLVMSHNADLALATLALGAEGFRLGRERAQERAILSLRDTARIDEQTLDLLDAVRRNRNQIAYEHAGASSVAEAQELQRVVRALRRDVVGWLKKKHPMLVLPDLTA